MQVYIILTFLPQKKKKTHKKGRVVPFIHVCLNLEADSGFKKYLNFSFYLNLLDFLEGQMSEIGLNV